jgi:hypothetical protein
VLPQQVAAVKELESRGANVHFAAVDVADETALRTLFSELQSQGVPAIRGVIHAAGVVEPKALVDLDLDDLKKVLHPKVAGAYALQTLLEDVPLDFFVHFSSASSLLSSPMLASYAAANAFLDAIAFNQRAQGKPAISVNWGFWSEVGLGARYRDKVGSAEGISAANGLAALEWILARDRTQLAVIPHNAQQWRRLRSQTGMTMLLSEIVSDVAVKPSVDAAVDVKALIAAHARGHGG